MAKRTRTTRTAQRRPANRPAPQRGPARPVSPRVVTAPLAPSQPLPAEVDAQQLVTDPPALSSGELAAVPRSTPGRQKIKANSLLAAKATTEYVYVGQDLRRIAIVGLSLFGTLIALWIVLVVLGLSGLY